jgi:hypothetical protein
MVASGKLALGRASYSHNKLGRMGATSARVTCSCSNRSLSFIGDSSTSASNGSTLPNAADIVTASCTIAVLGHFGDATFELDVSRIHVSWGIVFAETHERNMRFLSLSDRCSISKVRQTRSGSARDVDKAASCLFVIKRAGKLDKMERDAALKLIRRFTIRGSLPLSEGVCTTDITG